MCELSFPRDDSGLFISKRRRNICHPPWYLNLKRTCFPLPECYCGKPRDSHPVAKFMMKICLHCISALDIS
jgi:hypothetical protein